MNFHALRSSFHSSLLQVLLTLFAITPMVRGSSTIVTFTVDMTLQVNNGTFVPGTDKVAVRGTFNSWGTYNLTNNPTDPVNNKLYSGTVNDISDPNGGQLQYKFWNSHPSAENGGWELTANGQNRAAVLPAQTGATFVLPKVFFSDREQVSFQVDMTAQLLHGAFIPGVDTVDVRGNFNGWNQSVNICTNNPSDANTNIYRSVVNITDAVGATEQYKFTFYPNNTTNTLWENPVSSPTIGGNRYFIQPNLAATNLPVAFFSDEVPVVMTFQVDMTDQMINGAFFPGIDTVDVRGGFNNWNQGVNVCTNDLSSSNRNIYRASVAVADFIGSTQQFRFTHYSSNTNSTVWETPASSPTIGGNRFFIQPHFTPTTLPVVFFNDDTTTNSTELFNETNIQYFYSYNFSAGAIEFRCGDPYERGASTDTYLYIFTNQTRSFPLSSHLIFSGTDTNGPATSAFTANVDFDFNGSSLSLDLEAHFQNTVSTDPSTCIDASGGIQLSGEGHGIGFIASRDMLLELTSIVLASPIPPIDNAWTNLPIGSLSVDGNYITISNQAMQALVYRGQSVYIGVGKDNVVGLSWNHGQEGTGLGVLQQIYDIQSSISVNFYPYSILPFIMHQPTNQIVSPSAPARFSVKCGGLDPLYYQWKRNGINLTDSVNITGTHQANLSIASAGPSDEGDYQVVITNLYGATNSAFAALSVLSVDLSAVSIAWNPQIGGLDFSYSVTGGPLNTATSAKLFWANGTNIANIISSTPIFTQNIPAGFSGVSTNINVPGAAFAAIPNGVTDILLVLDPENLITESNKNNNILAFSITVPRIISQPTNRVVFPTDPASFTAKASGSLPLSYSWRLNGGNLTDSARLVGSQTDSLVISDAFTSDAGFYDVIVTNSYGSVTSAPVSLSILGVSPRFSNVQIINNQLVITVSGTTGQGTIILYNSTNLLDWDPIFTNPPTFNPIIITIPVDQDANKRFYFRTKTDASGTRG